MAINGILSSASSNIVDAPDLEKAISISGNLSNISSSNSNKKLSI